MEGRPYSAGTTTIRTIVTDMISESDRAKLVAVMADFKTGAQAKQQAHTKGLIYQALDHLGRVGVLKWRGIEVALLFQRLSTTTTVLPTELLAAKPLHEPDDAWILVNLLNTDRAAINNELTSKTQALEQQIVQMRGLVANMEMELGMAIDPEVYEAVKKERDTLQTRANQLWRAIERVDPEAAKRLKVSEPRVRTMRKDMAKESLSVKQARAAAKKEQERFEAAVEAEVQRRIAKVQAKHDREKIKMLKDVAVTRKIIARSLGVKQNKKASAKAGKHKPVRRTKTQVGKAKPKRP